MIPVQLADGRTIEIDTNDPKAAAKAAHAFQVKDGARSQAAAMLKRMGPLEGFTSNAASGFTAGLSRQAEAVGAAAGQGVNNLVSRLGGGKPAIGMADAYGGYLNAAKDYDAEHPVSSGLGGLLGALGTIGIGGGAIKAAAGGRAVGFVPRLAQTARASAAGLGVGAVQGGVQAAATARPGQRGQDAIGGAMAGGVTGAALPAAASAIAPIVRPVASTIARAANRVSGGRLLDSSRVAAQRMAEAFKAEGLTPDGARTAMNQWLTLGNDAPAVINLARRNGPVQRLVRSAAAKSGDASAAASSYADTTAANVQDRSQALAANLTPTETRTAPQYREAMDTQRSTQASSDYAAPNAERIKVTPELAGAVADAPGRSAIQRALQGAVAHQDYAQADELRGLLNLHVPDIEGMSPATMAKIRTAALSTAPDVSAGAVDRIQRAFREAGENAYSTLGDKSRDVGAGLFKRGGQVDASLADVEGLAPARTNFADNSNAMRAVDHGGTILNAPPTTYSPELEALATAPHVVTGAQVGARDAIANAIGAPTAGATGLLNRLSGSNNIGEKLAATFGDDAGPGFQQAIRNETRRVQDARFVDSSSGSQTNARGQDEGLVDHIPLSKHGLLRAAISAIGNGATLTDAERSAIVGFGTGPVDEDLLRKISALSGSDVSLPSLTGPAIGGYIDNRSRQ